jgi:hypothetical protein
MLIGASLHRGFREAAMTKLLTHFCGCLVLGVSLLPLSAAAQQQPPAIAGILAGAAVTDRDLSNQHGRGLNLVNDGAVTGDVNYSGGGGPISNADSIKNNTGITTVFQNTGNNSLFQNQTTINVALH